MSLGAALLEGGSSGKEGCPEVAVVLPAGAAAIGRAAQSASKLTHTTVAREFRSLCT